MSGPHTLPPEGVERRPASDPALPRPGDVLAKRYEVERLVARGGMACIFRARHLGLESTVAIKVMDPALFKGPSNDAARFTREARLASQLKHPSIVEIFDFGVTEGGLPFIVMEFLEGDSLGQLMQREPPLDWARARGFVLQVLEALQVAHDAGMVHRDIKPENCFLVRGLELVKVLDFGIAKVMHQAQRLTVDGNILGTPHYLSPEQACASAVDERTDVYAVGIMLYEMLCGSCPFEEGSALEIVAAHINATPPPLSSKIETSALPSRLQALLDRALAKNPDARPRDARAFAAEIRDLDREEVPVGYAWKRWALVGAAALGLGFAVGGVAALVGAANEEPPSQAAAALADASAAHKSEEPPPPPPREPAPTPEPDQQGAPLNSGVPAMAAGHAGVDRVAEAERGEGVAEDEAVEPQPVSGEPAAPARSTKGRPGDSGKSRRRRATRAPKSKRVDVGVLLRRATARCDKFAPPGGTAVQVAADVAEDGSLGAVRVAPPYGDTPMGRCVANAAASVSAPTGAASHFSGKIQIGAKE